MGAILAIVGVIATALLGASNPFQQGGNTATSSATISSRESCMPRLNKNRLLKVDVDPEVENIYTKDDNHAGGNKETKTWVLVKENAPIPAWKVDLYRRTGNNRTHPFAEMEKIGSSIALDSDSTNQDVGKEVYIGTGWCNPLTGLSISGNPNWPSTPCADPLVQDVLFVAVKKGMTYEELDKQNSPLYCDVDHCGDAEDPAAIALCRSNNGIFYKHFSACMDWGEGKRSEPPRTQANLQQYYWTFNVYYDASKLPANATADDLPCWMKLQCPNGSDVMGKPRITAGAQPNCEATTGDVLAATDPPDRPRLIIDKREITVNPATPLPPNITLANHYVSLSKLAQRPVADAETTLIGTAYQNRSTGAAYFNVWVRRGTVIGTATHIIILDPINHPDTGPWWSFSPILATSKPIANTLQLGTFQPGIPSFFYEWWTPSCKPALYFYPPKETNISVKVIPNGHITQSIPEYGTDGWKIKAYPDGKLFSRLLNDQLPITSNYLYYEAAVKNVSVPKDTGWIVETKNLPTFFNYTLPRLGLNDKESADFLAYWIPKLQEGNRWYITLIDPKELDRVEKIDISPKPDNFIRVRFYFEKIDGNEIAQSGSSNIWTSDFSYYSIIQLLNYSRQRDGFTVVDWGGIIANGSCGEEEVSR